MNSVTEIGENIFQRMSLSSPLSHSMVSLKRREIGDRVARVYEQFKEQLLALDESKIAFIFHPDHHYSTTITMIEDLYATSSTVTGREADQSQMSAIAVEWLSIFKRESFRKDIIHIDAILCSLGPPLAEIWNPDTPSLTGLMWAVLHFLYTQTNEESDVNITPEARGIFTLNDLFNVHCVVMSLFPPSTKITWEPTLPYFSEYVADGLASMYEIIIECLGKLLDYQIRAISAMASEIEALNKEGDEHVKYLEECLESLKSISASIMGTANDENEWRNSIIGNDLNSTRGYIEDGKPLEACQLLEKSIEKLEAMPPPPTGVEPRQIHLILLYELSQIYENSRDYEKKLVCVNRIHELHSILQGRCALGTLSNAFEAACLLQNLGVQESIVINIFKAVVDGMEISPGPDHHITAMAYMKLGGTLDSANRTDEGVHYLFKALDIYERDWQLRGASAQTVANILLATFNQQGQSKKSRDLCLRLVASCTGQLGPEHALTCTFLVDLGFNYLTQKNFIEAEQALRRASAGLEASLGAEHPETLRAMGNLASVFAHQSRFEEATMLHERVAEIRERTLGPDSWATLRSLTNLAATLASAGKIEKQAEILRTVKSRFDNMKDPTSYGEVYYHATNMLADVDRSSETNIKIGELEKQLAKITLSSPNFFDPVVTSIADMLISEYQRSERTEDAYSLARRALESCSSRNPDHPRTQSFRWQTAQFLQLRGRDEEAVAIYRIGLAECERLGAGGEEAIIMWEAGLGNALIQVGSEEDGVRTLSSALRHASSSPQHRKSLASYRDVFQLLFRHYTGPILRQDTAGAIRGPEKEVWASIVALLES